VRTNILVEVLSKISAKTLNGLEWIPPTVKLRVLYNLSLPDYNELRKIKDDAVLILKSLLSNDISWVARSAWNSLYQLSWSPTSQAEKDQVFNIAIESLRYVSGASSELTYALAYLVGSRDKNVIEPISRLLEHSEIDVKNLASEALYALGDPRGNYIYLREEGHFIGSSSERLDGIHDRKAHSHSALINW